MPTDAPLAFRDMMSETKAYGFDRLCDAQWEQGKRVRALLTEKGIKSMAATGFEAPDVVVAYAPSEEVKMGKPFVAEGVQIVAGVSLMCEESDDYQSFPLGLFGLDKVIPPFSMGRLP